MAASEQHAKASALIEAGREDEAYGVVMSILRRDRDDVEALWLLGNLHAKAEQYTSAWLALRRAAELRPSHHQIVNNVGTALEGLGLSEEARSWFERAHKKAPTNPNYVSNIGMTYLLEGDVRAAEVYASRAIEIDSEHQGAHTCRAFALLAQGRWAEGWDDYTYSLGTKFRAIKDYGLPTWNGEKSARVVVAAEQGIGDEIMYATCIPDLVARCEKVGFDCDKRTAKLFERALVDVEVRGTRSGDAAGWVADGGYTHQIMGGELPRFFRRHERDFERSRSFKLVVNDDLKVMYEALVARHSGEKMRIGLTTIGGGYHTGRKRALDVSAFAPMLARHGDRCAFFSLDYRADTKQRIDESGLDIAHFHFAVGQGADYDHTAAFVASMDLVVGIHTTAHHAAAVLGVPTITYVPSQPAWIYGTALGDKLPWYDSIKLFRQRKNESWAQTVKRSVDEAASDFRRL